MANSEAPVLVVGGRTTGMMMAAELARHGVPVRIVDKSPGIDPHSRATALHSRTLEILHSRGLAQQLVAVAQPLHGVSLYANGKWIARAAEQPVDSPYPYSVALSQAKTERLMEEHLRGLGVSIERNTHLAGLEQDDERVRATLVRADGRQETVDVPWLIGCDGAHSTVRELTEPSFPGEADPFTYLLADVLVEGPLDPADAYYFLHDEGELFVFILDEGRRLVTATAPPGSSTEADPTLEQMQQIVDSRGPGGLRLSDPRWLTQFHIHYRLAPHYRLGRTFLAGDAAHVHSLIGGQGMNTGMQDAHNLAWKLALVMQGVVPAAWLDSYEIERRSVAEDVIATTRLATEKCELFAGLSASERETLLAHMFVPESARLEARRHAEEIDLDYRASPLCFEPDEPCTRGPRAGSRAPDAGSLVVDGEPSSWFDVVDGLRHCLLLFAAPGRDLADLAAAAARARGPWLDAFVVAERPPRDVLPPGVRFIADAERVLYDRYGADEAALYLIRPDGYVAYRSRDIDGLAAYLARVP